MEDKSKKIADLMGNREKFNEFAYFSIHDAIKELEARKTDAKLDQYLESLPSKTPDIFEKSNKLVLFRHIATPNYEIMRFFIIADALDKLEPLILEYTDDKFTNRNEWKFSLAKLPFYKGENAKKESMFEYQNIIDMNSSNNMPISSIKTTWGQSLVDFHHEMMFQVLPHAKDSIFDLSQWLAENGHSAKAYYKSFFSIFLKHGILLENFLLKGGEADFVREIIMPALMEIEQETGKKPLIVALEPTEIEDKKFWLSHPHSRKKNIESKK